MIKKTIYSIIILLLCTGPSGIAEVKSGFNTAEDRMFQAFAAGDYHSLWASLRDMILNNHTEASTVLYYPDLADFARIVGYGEVMGTMQKLKASIEAEPDSRDKNSRLLLFRLAYEQFLYPYNRPEALRITRLLSPLSAWRIWGPYRLNGPADMDCPFSPEISSGRAGSGDSLTIDTSADDGTVDFSRHFFPHDGIAYASCSFSYNRPVKLRIYSPCSYRFFLNGRMVLSNDQANFRKMRIVRIDNTRNISILIKVQATDSWKFRMILTDDTDTIIKPDIRPVTGSFDSFDQLEEDEYPLAILKKQMTTAVNPTDQARLWNRTGTYFDLLESSEAIECHRRAYRLWDRNEYRFFLASSLEGRASNMGSWRRSEAGRLFKVINNNDPMFLPSRYKIFSGLADTGNTAEALALGQRLIADNPGHIPSWLELLECYDTINYEKEFLETLERFKKEFPHSVLPLHAETAFFKKRNIPDFEKVSRQILSLAYDWEILGNLVQFYKKRNDNNAIITLYRRFSFDDHLHNEYIDALIRKGDYVTAKQILFRDVSTRRIPAYYLKLGIIDNLNNYDASLYWHKVIAMDPSFFPLKDYMRCMTDASFGNPFEEYEKNIPEIKYLFESMKKYVLPSKVMLRNRIFLLENDGSSRVYCNDIIHLNDEKGVEKWGEYRIPFEGELHAIRFRVHYEDSSWSDSYRIQKINQTHFVNLSALKKNSIIHLQYIVDNPLRTPRLSRHFALPETLLQEYNEPVERLSVSVITPPGMNLHFYNSRDWDTSITEINEARIHSFSAADLPPIYNEFFSGSDYNCLPYFHFSTMKDSREVMSWYAGLVNRMSEPVNIPPAADAPAASKEEAISSVYHAVSRDVFLQRNVLYYPEDADTTWYRKSGTVEDKVILARTLLRQRGIESYMGLSRHSYLPRADAITNPELFSSPLLYVPLTVDQGYWLDFSNTFLPLGTVSPTLEGTTAYILINNDTMVQKTVHGLSTDYKREEAKITIDERGNARCSFRTIFEGSYGALREHFRDRLYLENTINSYYGNMISSLNIDHYAMNNLDTSWGAFTIEARGDALAFATAGRGKMILQPFISRSSIHRYIQYPERNHDLVISFPIQEEDTCEIIVPARYSHAEVMKKHELTSSFGSAEILIIKKRGELKMSIQKSVRLRSHIIKAQVYPEFLNFCMELNKLESQSLVLSADNDSKP